MARISIEELQRAMENAGVAVGDPRAMGAEQPRFNAYIQQQIEDRYADRLGKLDEEKKQKIQQLAEVDRTLTKLYRDPSSKFYVPNVGAVEQLRGRAQDVGVSNVGLTAGAIEQTQQQIEDEIKASQTLYQDLIKSFKSQEAAISAYEELSTNEDFTPEDFEILNQQWENLSEDEREGKMRAVFEEKKNNQIGTILPSQGPITQLYGARNKGEIFSGGINYGVDVAVPTNTPVAVPAGQWKVVDVYNKNLAQGPNNKNRSANKGYGNSVLVQNLQTGEKLRLSHLSRATVKRGDILAGGTRVGYTGATGNVLGKTGQHLDIEYYDSSGRTRDFLKSPYRGYLFG